MIDVHCTHLSDSKAHGFLQAQVMGHALTYTVHTSLSLLCPIYIFFFERQLYSKTTEAKNTTETTTRERPQHTKRKHQRQGQQEQTLSQEFDKAAGHQKKNEPNPTEQDSPQKQQPQKRKQAHKDETTDQQKEQFETSYRTKKETGTRKTEKTRSVDCASSSSIFFPTIFLFLSQSSSSI